MTGFYTVFLGRNSQYYFNLKSGNGQIILSSEGYTTKQSCLTGIDSVKANSPNDDRYDRLDSRNNQYYFNLKSSNGQIIGTSELYTTTSSRNQGIETCKRIAPNAEVRDATVNA